MSLYTYDDVAFGPCPWCVNPNDDRWSDDLCLDHEAEYKGITPDQIDKINDFVDQAMQM